MSPEQAQARAGLKARIEALLHKCADGSEHVAERDGLLLELAQYQMRWVTPYGNFAAQRLRGRALDAADAVPALPTDGFRFARISSRSEQEDLRRFQSSGTTQDTRSLHPLQDLSLYDLGAKIAARHALFPDLERMQLLILAPREAELPESSLSYMLARFVEWFGAAHTHYVWPIDSESLTGLDRSLREAERTGTPVALLGTSFAFVHALDALKDARYALPEKSRIMQTGGFKGRSREIAPDAMRAWLSERFGVPGPYIVAEYGMTELSSQLYETTLRDAALGHTLRPRRLWAPSFVRLNLVQPESMQFVEGAGEGLVRIDDLANLDSVAAIQTADVGVRDAHGVALRGRAQGAIARGCSITADELIQSQGQSPAKPAS